MSVDATDDNSTAVSGVGAGRILKKGVVVEVIYDPTLYGPEMQEKIVAALNLKNADRLPTAPRNSCIVREYGEGKGTSTATMLVYPFFPPHLCFPVKPGECVWLISPGLGALDVKEAFWISRITTPGLVEDINYTHLPRGNNIVLKLPSAVSVPPFAVPDFTDRGADGKPIIVPDPKTATTLTNEFDQIVWNSESYKNFTTQPVPKFSKRVGDFVIQGSNNTLISLGEDRGWTFTDTAIDTRAESNVVPPAGEFAGSIDIVAGRSRYLPENATSGSVESDAPVGTGFRTTTNLRDYVENDKNPVLNTFDPNPPAEGDPDFRVDAARIYVSMKTNGDLNFGINQDTTSAGAYTAGTVFVPGTSADLTIEGDEDVVSEASTESTLSTPGGGEERMATGFEAVIEPIADAAYIVAKADELRFIARKQVADTPVVGAAEINGSIRLIKEGVKNEDLATICLLPDGTIQISGYKIYIGRPGDDDGRDAGPGEGGSEPYVRYSDLKTLWEEVMDELTTFCETLEKNTTPGYGSPSVQVVNAAVALRTAIDTAGQGHKKNIETVASERIFGE